MPLYTRRRLGAALMTVVLTTGAATLAACAGDVDAPGVATAATGASPAPAPTATSGVIAEYVEAMRGYVACMRDNGIDLPDPGPKGEIAYGDTRRLKSDPTFLSASKKCSDLHPTVPAELEATLPPLTEEQIGFARAYAACMRANGLPDFTDPGPDGYFREDRGASDPSEQQAAVMFRAGQICRPVLEGKPPTTPNPNETGQG